MIKLESFTDELHPTQLTADFPIRQVDVDLIPMGVFWTPLPVEGCYRPYLRDSSGYTYAMVALNPTARPGCYAVLDDSHVCVGYVLAFGGHVEAWTEPHN